jgi:hypothetical protein
MPPPPDDPTIPPPPPDDPTVPPPPPDDPTVPPPPPVDGQRAALVTPFTGGFDPRRIPVELQAWWEPAFGHVHALALLPVGQTVSGTMEFDVRIVMHDNPSLLRSVQLYAEGNLVTQVNVGRTFEAEGTHTISVRMSADTNKMQDGWRELRLRAVMETPDGNKFFNSSGIPVYVDNGKPDSNYERATHTSLVGRGWYEGFGYANAYWESIPTTKVSGTLSLRVKGQNEGDGQLVVALDADHGTPGAGPWQAVPPTTGQVLLNTTKNVQSWNTVTLDTTQLANGWHSLAARAANNDTGSSLGIPGNRNEGVAKFWFWVEN